MPILDEETSGPEAWLKVRKTDTDGKPLAGAKFAVYDNESCTGRPVKEFTTDANGNGAVKVEWKGSSNTKTFWVKETQAPDGYRGSKEAYEAPLNALIHKDEASAYLVRGGPWKNTTGKGVPPGRQRWPEDKGHHGYQLSLCRH